MLIGFLILRMSNSNRVRRSIVDQAPTFSCFFFVVHTQQGEKIVDQGLDPRTSSGLKGGIVMLLLVVNVSY
jgi:hypothetical protein